MRRNAKLRDHTQFQETDVSMSMTNCERQEWSVTLYDVDRKGNVSEEVTWIAFIAEYVVL